MRSTVAVAQGVAWRTLHNVFTNPSLLFPSLIFPLFFFIAFAGGLSRVADVPGFEYPPGYTAFQYVFVLLQSAAFGGVFTGFGIARDFESGFARRLLLAAPNRSGIVIGYGAAALVRWMVTAAFVTVLALPVGMDVVRQRDRPVRALHARAAREHRRGAVGERRRDAAADDAGRARDADARVPRPLLRAGVRPAGAARRMDPRGSRRSIPSRASSRPAAASSPALPRSSRRRSSPRRSSRSSSRVWAFRGLRSAERAG